KLTGATNAEVRTESIWTANARWRASLSQPEHTDAHLKLSNGCRFVDPTNKLHQLLNSFHLEHLLRPFWGHVDERAFIEQTRIHHAFLCEVLDDHVEELDLIGGGPAVRNKIRERFRDC